MEKMPSADEQRIMRSLMSVVDNTRSGADPTKAMVKVASSNGFTPEIIKRMCESYNKAKSVHMLKKTASDQRADSFPIINSDNVISAVFGQGLEKAAGEFRATPNLLKVDFHTAMIDRMEKTASDRMDMMDKEAEKGCAGQEPNFDLVYDRLKKKEIREQGTLEKEASEIRQEKIRISKTVTSLAQHLRSYPNKQLNKVAQQIYNKYDAKGDQLLDVVYAKLGKDKPAFEKTAKTVIFPLAEPYVSVTRAMEGYKHYADLTSAQKKIEKSASVASILAAAGLPTINEAALAATEKDVLDDKGKNILGSELTNRLKRLDAIDTFSDMYTRDEFLRGQPIEKVMQAFNSITSMMPSLMANDARKEQIRPLLKKLVSEGNRVDPLDISRFNEMETNMSKTDKATKENIMMDKEIKAADRAGIANAPVGQTRLLDAIEKSKQPSKPVTAFSNLTKGVTSGLQQSLEGFDKGVQGITGAVTKLKDNKDKEEQLKLKAKDDQQKKLEKAPLVHKFDALGEGDRTYLKSMGVLDEVTGPMPTDKTKQDAISNYITGKAVKDMTPDPDISNAEDAQSGNPVNDVVRGYVNQLQRQNMNVRADILGTGNLHNVEPRDEDGNVIPSYTPPPPYVPAEGANFGGDMGGLTAEQMAELDNVEVS